MSGTNHVLHIELSTDCAPDVIEQLPPRLATLVHRTVTSASDLTKVLQEKNWDAIVCSDSRPATDPLHLLFANLPGITCLIRLDADNVLHFPYASGCCFALMGITPQEIELYPELLLDKLHPEDRDTFYKSMQESIARHTPWNWEGRVVLPPDGEIKWLNLRATYLETNLHYTLWDGFMFNITQNKLAEQEIKTSRQRLRELSAHVESIKEEERGRIAREIHDEIGVLLTALKMDMVWLAKRLPHDNPVLQEKTQTMVNLLETAGNTVNSLIHSLRPGFLDCFGIVAAIEIEAKEFIKRTGIPCKIVKSDEGVELPGEQSIALFRVFQEALNNIMKHAAARQVQIEILNTGKRVDLVISDDGKGFDETVRNKPHSFGLLGIQERIKHLGGDVRITSEPGKGTQIAVCVPLGDAGGSCEYQQTLF